MARATVRLTNDAYRTTISSRHHVYYADESQEDGGADTAPMPTEMLMGALGACIAITLKKYADRKKWPLEGVDVAVDYARFNGADYDAYEGDEQYVHEIREKITLHGPLTEEQKARLMDIATKCPVRRVISTPSFFKEELADIEGLPE